MPVVPATQKEEVGGLWSRLACAKAQDSMKNKAKVLEVRQVQGPEFNFGTAINKKVIK
jgi:hypothetical protein